MTKDSKHYYRLYSRSAKWRAARREYMRKWYSNNRQRWLDYKRKYTHGEGSVEHFNKQKKKQNHRCAICRRRMKQANQDHNHKTKQLRGVLCSGCNCALGYIENKRWMVKAVRYLKQWSK